MLYPRLASLGIITMSILVFIFMLTPNLPISENSILGAIVLLAIICCFAGILAGLGGIFASFGLEPKSSGCVQERKNFIGWVMKKSGLVSESFCGTSVACGFGLFVVLLIVSTISGVVYISYYVAPNANVSFTEMGLQLLFLLGLMFAFLVALAGLILIFQRSRVFSTIILVTMVSVLVYAIWKKGEDMLEVLLVFGVVALFAGVFFGLPLLAKKISFYRKVCPVLEKGSSV